MDNTNSTKPQQEQLPPPPPCQSEPNVPFTCQLCSEPMLSNNKFQNDNLCIHPFCIDCITKYLQYRIEDERVAKINCPRLFCDQLLDPLRCQTLIPPKLFDQWCDLLCERSLLGLDRCYCPNRRCSAVVVNECGGVLARPCEESGDVAFGVFAKRKKWRRCPQEIVWPL